MSEVIDRKSLIRAIADGARPGAILLSMLSDAQRLSLARCALVRYFDADLFQCLGVGGVRLDDLVALRLVEPLDDDGDLFSISSSLRDDAWEQWWLDRAEETPAPLAAAAADLADYYRHPYQRIERLRQLVISDISEAERLFTAVYQEADRGFDLARCQDAVDALSEFGRDRFLTSHMREYRDDCQCRTTARSAWATDFLQTADAHFQPRPEAERDLGRLLEPGKRGPWLLQLYGDGGTGKTMLLRRFISQVCVANKPLIPCARIDGDAIDPVVLLDCPSLLLLEAAAQLNSQLPNGPFRELLRAFGDRRGQLHRMPQDVGAADRPESQLAGIAADVESGFCRALAVGSRVLIVVDTLDDIVELGRSVPKRLEGLFALLRRMHKEAPEVRVVLAGREDLRQVPGARLPRGRVIDCSVGVFSPEEARSYLEDRRHIVDRGIVDAIIRKCAGVPYLVAAVADEVENDQGLTAEKIDNIAKPIVNYVHDRVLARIGDPVVSWSLRYSVVAPVLSFEFFRDVMMPELRESGPDDSFITEVMTRAARGRRGVALDVPGRADAAAVERRWRSVLSHAAAVRWMSAESPAGQNLVIINSTVRDVLRAHIRAEPAFVRLHERAIAHYAALIDGYDGKDFSADWLSWTKAAIFHSFQLGEANAAIEWRAAVAQAGLFGRLDWVRELAAYLPGPDFQDAQGRSAISSQVLYEAHVALARVVAQCAGRLPGPPWTGSVLWPDEAKAALDLAQELLDVPGATVTAVEIHADLRALLAVEDGRDGNGEAQIRTVNLGNDAGQQTAEAWLARARGHARRVSAGAAADVTALVLSAYRSAREAYGDDVDAVEYVDSEAGEWLLANDRPDLALDWSEYSDLARLRVAALLALGRPASAVAALPHVRLFRESCLAALAWLALRQPAAALRELTAHPAADADAEPVEQRIERELLMANGYAKLYELDAAERCLGRAQTLVSDADELNNARVHTAAALFYLRIVRNVNLAANSLDQEFPALDESNALWVRLRLAKAELADRRGHLDEVTAILDDVRASLIARHAPASLRAEVALAGLAVKANGWSGRRREYLAALADDLELVVPAGARLAMLTGLRRCQPVDAGPLAARLLALTADGGQYVNERDKAWQDLTRAHLRRVVGDNDGYGAHRDNAWIALRESDLYIDWELIEADAEFGLHHRLDLDRGHFSEHYADHPMLVARFTTEWADQYGDTIARPDRWLSQAAGKVTAAQLQQTVCGARLHEVRSKYAHARGDSQLAEDLAAKANAIWARLGDPRRVGPGGTPGDLELAEVAVPNAVSQALVRADRDSADVLVGSRSGPLADLQFRAAADFAAAGRWIGDSVQSWGSAAGQRLGDGLRPLLPRPGGGQLDVYLEFPGPALAAYPWELTEVDGLTLVGHPGVRYIARSVEGAYQGRREVLYQQHLLEALGITVGLADGLAGPQYRAGIGALARRFGSAGGQAPSSELWAGARAALRQEAKAKPRKLRVLVVQPLVAGTLDLLRRSGERTKQLERTYRTAFRDEPGVTRPTLAFSQASGGEVASLLWPGGEQRPVDILHVCTVMEATEQMPVLGLDARSGPPLDAAELDQMVRGLTGVVPPLVVLDVQPPPSPVDVRRQLLMRNRFAHQLLALGNVDTVIATGLAARQDATEQWQCIADGLAGQLTAAEICRRIQDLGTAGSPDTASTGDAVAYSATAFFTSVHPDVLVEPGLLIQRGDD